MVQKLNLVDTVYKMHASDCDFSSSQFEDINLSDSKVTEASYAGSQFTEVMFDRSQFFNTSWVDVSISNSRYDGMTIEGISVPELLALYRKYHLLVQNHEC